MNKLINQSNTIGKIMFFAGIIVLAICVLLFFIVLAEGYYVTFMGTIAALLPILCLGASMVALSEIIRLIDSKKSKEDNEDVFTGGKFAQ